MMVEMTSAKLRAFSAHNFGCDASWGVALGYHRSAPLALRQSNGPEYLRS